MPLYQEQGNDGFFVVREFRTFWLRFSTHLRRAGADRFVHLMPGVRRLKGREHALLVNRGVAKWFALQFLHLLGFRKLRARGSRLLVTRRHHDR